MDQHSKDTMNMLAAGVPLTRAIVEARPKAKTTITMNEAPRRLYQMLLKDAAAFQKRQCEETFSYMELKLQSSKVTITNYMIDLAQQTAGKLKPENGIFYRICYQKLMDVVALTLQQSVKEPYFSRLEKEMVGLKQQVNKGSLLALSWNEKAVKPCTTLTCLSTEYNVADLAQQVFEAAKETTEAIMRKPEADRSVGACLGAAKQTSLAQHYLGKPDEADAAFGTTVMLYNILKPDTNIYTDEGFADLVSIVGTGMVEEEDDAEISTYRKTDPVRGKHTCMMCFSMPMDYIFPCGHPGYCNDCVRKYKVDITQQHLCCQCRADGKLLHMYD